MSLKRRSCPFGKCSVLHAASPLRLSEDLPISIEAVDSRTETEAVISEIAPLVKGGQIVIVPINAYVRLD